MSSFDSVKPHGLIPFFVPHAGCPQQCTFCNQNRIAAKQDYIAAKQNLISAKQVSHDCGHKGKLESGHEGGSGGNQREAHEPIVGSAVTADAVTQAITDYVGSARQKKFWEVAFYGGSFTAIDVKRQEALLAPAYEALKKGRIDGIRCSTRPDAVGDEALQRLQRYGVKTVELGVQSMVPAILEAAKRGHTAQDTEDAVKRLKRYGFNVGIQLLPGLLGETWQTVLYTTVKIGQLKPDFVRIYPVLVIEDTELADQYRAGIYEPLSTEKAIQYSAFMKTYLEDRGITVIRTGLQATEELDSGAGLVAGPYEPAMGELVANRQWRWRIETCLDEYRESWSTEIGTMPKQVVVQYPRALTSKLRGLKKCNVAYFEQHYSTIEWLWQETKLTNLKDDTATAGVAKKAETARRGMAASGQSALEHTVKLVIDGRLFIL